MPVPSLTDALSSTPTEVITLRQTKGSALAHANELGIPDECLSGRGLCEYAEAQDLQAAEIGRDGEPRLLIPAAATAWQSLREAAREDGIELFIVSSFRSVERQCQIFRNKLTAGLSLDEILATNAPPGYSEHHTGRAIDISTPGCPSLTPDFEHTAAFAWLQQHAGEYGFRLSFPRGNTMGYIYEPWHWCFIPETIGQSALTPTPRD